MTDNISEWRAVSRASQSHDGAVSPASIEEKRQTGGGTMNTGTICGVECPECGTTGDVVAWHGHNCFYACPDCGTVVRVLG